MPSSFASDASHGALTGKVLDRNGNIISNASLTLEDHDEYTVGSAVSARDGTFSFNNISITGSDGRDVFRLLVEYAANNKTYSDKTEFFWIYRNQLTTHDVVMYYYPPSGYGWLTGKVVDANNYKQYVPATIYLSNGMYYIVSGEPGDNWQFYLPEGDYQVWAERNLNGKTYTSGKSDVTVRGDDIFTAVLTISLTDNCTTTYHDQPASGVNIVHGKITQKNNAPLYGATVQLCKITGSTLDPVMSTNTSVDGSYEFRDVNISSPMEKFAIKLTYAFMGSDYTKVSDAFIVNYNNMLGHTHDYDVPMSVDFVDSASLEIISTPAGAHIWIDGMDSGRTTPFNFTGMKAGNHTASLLLDGYMPENVTVNIAPQTTEHVNKQLKSSTGDVCFIVKPGDASVYVNGELAGKGVVNMTKLQYGEYSYTVSRDGFNNITGTFEVLPGEHMDIPVELVAVPGISLTYLGYLIDSIVSSIGKIL